MKKFSTMAVSVIALGLAVAAGAFARTPTPSPVQLPQSAVVNGASVRNVATATLPDVQQQIKELQDSVAALQTELAAVKAKAQGAENFNTVINNVVIPKINDQLANHTHNYNWTQVGYENVSVKKGGTSALSTDTTYCSLIRQNVWEPTPTSKAIMP